MSSNNRDDVDVDGEEEEEEEMRITKENLDKLRRIIDLEYGGDGILSSDNDVAMSGRNGDDVVDLVDSDSDDDDDDDDEYAIDLTGDDDDDDDDDDMSRETDQDGLDDEPTKPSASNRREFEAKDLPQSLLDEMNKDMNGQALVLGQHRDMALQESEVTDGCVENENDDESISMDLPDDFIDDDDGRNEDLTSAEDRRIGRELIGFEQKEGPNDNDDEDLVDGTVGVGDMDGKRNNGIIKDWSNVSSIEYKNSKTGQIIIFEVGKPYRVENKYPFDVVWIWRFASSKSAYVAKVRDAKATFLGAESKLKNKMYEDDLIVNKKLFDKEIKMNLPFDKVKVIRKQPYKLDDLLKLEDTSLQQASLPDWTYSRRVQTQIGSEYQSSSYKFGYYYQPPPPVLTEKSGEIETGLPSRNKTQVQRNLATRQIIPTRDGLRRGRRRKNRVLDLFCGFGGMHQGIARLLEFEHAAGVELDPTAVETFKKNYPNDYIWQGDVREFLHKASTDHGFREKIGRVDYIHASPPCQGFSGANINGGKNDEKNNDLSLIVIDYINFFRPDAFSFENVEGMWRGKHVHYLRVILKQLLNSDYHFHFDVLKACDYGDPQTRRRLIILASKLHIPVPALPTPTHGKDGMHNTTLQPYVTVGDVLSNFPERKKNDKYDGLRPTNPGQSKNMDAIVLDPNKVAPTLRATGPPVFHPFEDRALTVLEYQTLFSHDPETFRVVSNKRGNTSSQYRQIGNSVPVKLAEAIARSVAEVLRYEWKDIEATNTALYQSSSTASTVVGGDSDGVMVDQDAGMQSQISPSTTTSTIDESDRQMKDKEKGNTTATSDASHQ